MVEESQEYGRPRRPKPETISYLRGLPLDETLAIQQARAYIDYLQKTTESSNPSNPSDPPQDSEYAEYPPILSATHSALSTLANELASLSCEEASCSQIETLVRIACRYSNVAKTVILRSFRGYWVFLASHRFGSHVAQTVLRCCVNESEVSLEDVDGNGGEWGGEDGDEANEAKMVVNDAYESLLQNENGSDISMSLLLLEALQELKPYASDLAVHICGTHVLRTAFCILAGVEFVDAFAPTPTASTSADNSNSGTSTNRVSDWDNGPLAATRRGKFKDKKKKKKKPKQSHSEEEKGARQEVTVMKPINLVGELDTSKCQKEMGDLLKEMVHVISGCGSGREGGVAAVQPPGELQQRTCHPSSGPLLVQILRLLAYRDYHSNTSKSAKKKMNTSDLESVVGKGDKRLGKLPLEPTYSCGSEAEMFVHRLICWDSSLDADAEEDQHEEESDEENEITPETTSEKSLSKQPYAGDIIYGLSGEPRGSILLEAIFRCCPDLFHDKICTVGGFYDKDTLREYIYHGVSNFVVQSLFASVRSRSQAAKLVKPLCEIVEDGTILKIKGSRPDGSEGAHGSGAADESHPGNNQRMGVIWRACEMCAVIGSPQDQEQLLHALMRGYASSQDGSVDSSKVESETGDGGGKRKKRSKAKGMSVEECIPRLLGLSPGGFEEGGESMYESNSGGRLTLDAAGARSLHHIFHFHQRLRSDWVNGLINVYGPGDLAKIANDGLGSRCIMDALLDGPAKPHASKLLQPKLSGRLAFLAAERVGHHTILKLFSALPTSEDKAAVSVELSHSLNRLGSNAMGRSVMASCLVKEYLEGEGVWKDALAKQQEKENWLEDILTGGKDTTGRSGKKRKRKRKGGDEGTTENVDVTGNDCSDDESEEKNKKKKKEKKKRKKSH